MSEKRSGCGGGEKSRELGVLLVPASGKEPGAGRLEGAGISEDGVRCDLH